jgi:hypothetical protein
MLGGIPMTELDYDVLDVVIHMLMKQSIMVG